MGEETEHMNIDGGEEVNIDVIEAFERVLMKAAICDGLRRGLHESAKAIDRGAARLCVLSNDCNNEEYKRLVQALCAESRVPLIMADSGTLLGQWVGLAKLNPDGTVRKAVCCSVAVVTDYGEDTIYLRAILDFVKSTESSVVSLEPGKGLSYQWVNACNPQQPFKHHESNPTLGKPQYKSASKNLFDGGGSELYHLQESHDRDKGRSANKHDTKHKIGNERRSEKGDR